MIKKNTHIEQIAFLKKIEGQVRGVQKMVEEGRYCVDIITQVHSAIGALYRVEEQILKKHLNHCVANALKGSSEKEKQEKKKKKKKIFFGKGGEHRKKRTKPPLKKVSPPHFVARNDERPFQR